MPKLNFKYCDCGCKCFQADVYHIYWDLKTKYYVGRTLPRQPQDLHVDGQSREGSSAPL